MRISETILMLINRNREVKDDIMRLRLAKLKVGCSIVLCLCFSANNLLRAADPIISVDGNAITLKNDIGCKLVIWNADGRYGLGTFYFDGVALGAPIEYFATESNVFFASSSDQFQQLYPGSWSPHYQASKYEILENTSECGTIKFSGGSGKLDGSVTITLLQGSTGYKLDYDMKMRKAVKHPLYVSGSFFSKNMRFVQYPGEDPIIAPFQSQWEIIPTRATVPFMFGSQVIDGKEYYVGVGYQLGKDDYRHGKLQYNAAEIAPFQIYFTNSQPSGWFGRDGKFQLHIVISTAATQWDCVSGYRSQSGYDISTPIRRTLDNSLKGVMNMYKESTVYVSLPPFKNKAYHQQVNPYTGSAPLYGYGAYIPIGVNVQLAYQFYIYWQKHPDETWAKERAINMANFCVETQATSGAIPTLWDPKAKRFRAYQSPMDELGYIYATCQQSIAAHSLYRLYLARLEAENIAMPKWKDAAIKAINDIASKVQPDGLLGRSYDKNGKYDNACAANWPLIALDYFYDKTGDKKYDEARARLEKWVYKNFVYPNLWTSWSSDGAGWRFGPSPHNIDLLNSQSFATYCIFRHMRTNDPKYIEWAKHIISYNWLGTIPIQFPGYKNVTKGLVREQDWYTTYDVPFRVCMYIDFFPYLSMITGDRFFQDFYKLMIQTQMAYQNLPPMMQSFNIGLEWDESGSEPLDEIGEQQRNYIVEFCSMFLESVNSPNAYRYVGGPDWGVGLDYDITFTPDFKKNEPYIAAASTNLASEKWDTSTKTIAGTLLGDTGDKGVLYVKWTDDKDPANNCTVVINGEILDKKSMNYNPNQNLLMINYEHKQKVLTFQISEH